MLTLIIYEPLKNARLIEHMETKSPDFRY